MSAVPLTTVATDAVRTLPAPAPAPTRGSLEPYWVTFYERDAPQKRLAARLGEAPPTPSSSGSDWEVVALPKRSAVSIWRGRSNLIAMDVPVILGDAGADAVNPAATTLARMWRPHDPTVRPPVVKVIATGDAVPYQQLDYYVASIAWGDALGGRESNRVLQKLTVTLGEFREDEILQEARASRPRHRGRTYTVRAGDTLSRIAERFKVKGGWRALADAQHPPIRDPRTLRVGRRLLIP